MLFQFAEVIYKYLSTVPDMRKPLDAQFVNTSGLDEVGYGQGVNRAFIQQLGL